MTVASRVISAAGLALRPIDQIGDAFVGRIGLRRRAALDLALMTGLFLIDSWVLKPLHLRAPSAALCALLAIWALGSFRRIQRTRVDSGLPVRHGWVQSYALTLALTLTAIGAVAAVAHAAGVLVTQPTWGPAGPSRGRLAAKLAEQTVGVVAQQVGLHLLLLPLCYQLCVGKAAAVAVAALVFALLHVPNALLVACCLLIVPCWFWLFQHGRRLTPLVLSHLVLAVFIRSALPSHVHLGLAIGGRAVPRLRRAIQCAQPANRHQAKPSPASQGASDKPRAQQER